VIVIAGGGGYFYFNSRNKNKQIEITPKKPEQKPPKYLNME